MTDTLAPSGPEIIRAFARTLPASPGVYRMLDGNGEVIYVGKARSLKARVTNYTRPEGLDVRIQRRRAMHDADLVPQAPANGPRRHALLRGGCIFGRQGDHRRSSVRVNEAD